MFPNLFSSGLFRILIFIIVVILIVVLFIKYGSNFLSSITRPTFKEKDQTIEQEKLIEDFHNKQKELENMNDERHPRFLGEGFLTHVDYQTSLTNKIEQLQEDFTLFKNNIQANSDKQQQATIAQYKINTLMNKTIDQLKKDISSRLTKRQINESVILSKDEKQQSNSDKNILSTDLSKSNQQKVSEQGQDKKETPLIKNNFITKQSDDISNKEMINPNDNKNSTIDNNSKPMSSNVVSLQQADPNSLIKDLDLNVSLDNSDFSDIEDISN